MSLVTLGAEGLEGNVFLAGDDLEALAVAVHYNGEIGIRDAPVGLVNLPSVQMTADHQADAGFVQHRHEKLVYDLIPVPSALAGRDVAEDYADVGILALGGFDDFLQPAGLGLEVGLGEHRAVVFYVVVGLILPCVEEDEEELAEAGGTVLLAVDVVEPVFGVLAAEFVIAAL